MTADLIREAREYADEIDKDRGFESGLTKTLRSLAVALERAEERARIAETDRHVNYPEWLAERERLLAALERAEKERGSCDFGCGPGGDENVEPGFGIVPSCPVHGWVCAWLDRLRAENEKLREALSGIILTSTWRHALHLAEAALRVDDPDEAELRREADMPPKERAEHPEDYLSPSERPFTAAEDRRLDAMGDERAW